MKLKTTFTPEENQIAEIKYKSAPFGKMSGEKVLSECKLLLLKVSVITGWQIPDAELKKILIEQFCRKMVEAYPTVNPDEVEYAFRNRDVEIKDWGKYFSITLLDEVLQPYIIRRQEVSRIEEQIKSKPLQIEHKEDMSDSAMQDWIDSWIANFQKINIQLIPILFYDWLAKTKSLILDKNKKFEYLQKASEMRQTILAENATDLISEKKLADFSKMKASGCITGFEIEMVKDLAKKISVYDYLKNKFDERHNQRL